MPTSILCHGAGGLYFCVSNAYFRHSHAPHTFSTTACRRKTNASGEASASPFAHVLRLLLTGYTHCESLEGIRASSFHFSRPPLEQVASSPSEFQLRGGLGAFCSTADGFLGITAKPRNPDGRAAQPSFPLALAETGAVAQPREFDIADHRIAVVEGHDLSGLVPLEAHHHPTKLKGIASDRFELQSLVRRKLEAHHQAVFSGHHLED